MEFSRMSFWSAFIVGRSGMCVEALALVVCSVIFFKQKTAYEMRISDWSSDVCSSDLIMEGVRALIIDKDKSPRWNPTTLAEVTPEREIGRASCRERVCQYV